MVKSSADIKTPPSSPLVFDSVAKEYYAGDYVIVTGMINNTFGYNLFEDKQYLMVSGEGYRSSEESALGAIRYLATKGICWWKYVI